MFQTPNEFSLYIENLVLNDKSLTHVDAILKYCSENQIDEEDVKPLVNKSLTGKLKEDFTEMRFFKRDTGLNF